MPYAVSGNITRGNRSQRHGQPNGDKHLSLESGRPMPLLLPHLSSNGSDTVGKGGLGVSTAHLQAFRALPEATQLCLVELARLCGPMGLMGSDGEDEGSDPESSGQQQGWQGGPPQQQDQHRQQHGYREGSHEEYMAGTGTGHGMKVGAGTD